MIADCGELPEDYDLATINQDDTGDAFADYPTDSGIDFTAVSFTELHCAGVSALNTVG